MNYDYLICDTCYNLAEPSNDEGDTCICDGKFVNGERLIKRRDRALEILSEYLGGTGCPNSLDHGNLQTNECAACYSEDKRPSNEQCWMNYALHEADKEAGK